MSARDLLANARRTAVLSQCGMFRYRLGRRWHESSIKPLLYVMLNPSTADAHVDDATIRRCATFADAHGYHGFEVVNLYAYRATDPKELRRAGWPVGPENDMHIIAALADSDPEVCVAWGSNAADLSRPAEVLALLRKWGRKVSCLRITSSGHPQHPLMLHSDCRLQPYPARPGVKS
jgi:hypothetical protein